MSPRSADPQRRRRAFVGRTAAEIDADTNGRDPSDWAILGLLGLAVALALTVIVAGDWALMAIFATGVAIIGVSEFERRRVRIAHQGFVDARVGDGVILFDARTAAAWWGVLMIVLSALVILFFALFVSGPSTLEVRRVGLVVIFAFVGLFEGARVVIRAVRSVVIRVDAQGVTVSSRLGGRERATPWEEVDAAVADAGGITILRTSRPPLRCAVGYARTDPGVIADVISRCALEPSLRPLLGDATIDGLKAEERWRRDRAR